MYYVSVQWNKGPHYFIAGPIALGEAIQVADAYIIRLKKRKTGVNPTVRVLLVAEETKNIKKEG